MPNPNQFLDVAGQPALSLLATFVALFEPASFADNFSAALNPPRNASTGGRSYSHMHHTMDQENEKIPKTEVVQLEDSGRSPNFKPVAMMINDPAYMSDPAQ